ncbi:SDR family oxidoreductase [Halocatena halophila]|uniref:SDR family oxidoreductase n=1 Tax=Halocatena halophila TaxID=2814576 RepID=UPI002ED229CB
MFRAPYSPFQQERHYQDERGLRQRKPYHSIGNLFRLVHAGHPDDIVGATLFLASDEASSITGDLLFVDGGWTAI